MTASRRAPVPTLFSELRLTPLDAFWHLTHLILPAWTVAALMAMFVKLFWKKSAGSLTWAQLTLWGGAGGTMALLAALLLMGRDGTMAGYGAMLLGVTLPQWGLTIRR